MLLYFGREIIIPVALAILLSFVLAPLVGALQRLRVPRGLCGTRFDGFVESCRRLQSFWVAG